VGVDYTKIGSEKLFSKMSDVSEHIFLKIMTRMFECISNLLEQFHCYICMNVFILLFYIYNIFIK
jgi:hypothetical protein